MFAAINSYIHAPVITINGNNLRFVRSFYVMYCVCFYIREVRSYIKLDNNMCPISRTVFYIIYNSNKLAIVLL